MTTTHAETVRVLVTAPPCIDAAIKRLEELGDGRDANVLSDLAAAYFVRAQRDDRPSDLLRSLESAERAVAAAGKSPAANFNLALAQEASGFTAKADQTWDAVSRMDRSGWAVEAGTRHQEIVRAAALNAATQWRVNQGRIIENAEREDREAVFNLVRPFPFATQRYVEDEILPAWALAVRESRPADAARYLRQATVIAGELMRATGDPYLHEAIDSIARARGEMLRVVARGHETLQHARSLDRAYASEDAARAYADAGRDLGRAGSPMRFGAQLDYYTQLTRREDKRAGKDGLASLAEQTRDHYRNVWCRAQSNRGYVAQIEGRYLESLGYYDAAQEAFRLMGDEENLARVHIRKAGIYRVLGQQEAALGESARARRYMAKLLDVGSRNLLAGETAATALELGFPRIAFQYHSAFLDALHEEQQTAPADDATQRQMRLNRAIALRGRAAIRLHLGQGAEALRELQEASGIAVQTPVDQKIEKALRARIAEVRGEAALRSKNPRLAISEFTAALDLASSVTYRTFEAILLARRAEAHRMAGNVAGAREDLEAAIERVNAEEADLLAGHWRGQGEGLWRDYFSRFQESYGRLITLLSVDDRRRAFAYAEKARAFEPLKLVLELPVGAEVVRSLDTKSVTPKALEAIQAALPLGTFVFEYQVTAEQTFVWVLSHDDFDMRTLPVGKAKIENWLRTLQHDGASQSRQRFERSLDGPFEALLRVPLALMTGMKNGKLPSRRLVIVPDRFTHGLPFAALHDAVAGDYLVERFPLTVAPSATLYIYALDRDAKLADAGGTPSALLVGDPAFNDQLELAHGMERLGAARAEAAELEALYAPNSKSLVDLQATVPAFLEQSQHRTIVHVAGHALVNRRAPFGTFLLMAPAKGHNGLLYTDELLTRLQLDQARLVVLAACSSAGGVPVGPEGLAPLVRPFIAAGVPGVVGSLWTINDQRSKKVLVEFLHRYREGHDAASALRLAQIHFLRRRREGIPILAWAAFQNVGYASSPYARSAIANRGIQ